MIRPNLTHFDTSWHLTPGREGAEPPDSTFGKMQEAQRSRQKHNQATNQPTNQPAKQPSNQANK